MLSDLNAQNSYSQQYVPFSFYVVYSTFQVNDLQWPFRDFRCILDRGLHKSAPIQVYNVLEIIVAHYVALFIGSNIPLFLV
jgi:hypothetical protein